jgi:hypothetical protein
VGSDRSIAITFDTSPHGSHQICKLPGTDIVIDEDLKIIFGHKLSPILLSLTPISTACPLQYFVIHWSVNVSWIIQNIDIRFLKLTNSVASDPFC